MTRSREQESQPALAPADALKPGPQRFDFERYLSAAFQAAVLATALYTVYLVIRFYSPLPKWDQWAEVLWLKNYYAGQWHLSDLWRQHNEHRILFPRLLFLADFLLFRGTNAFLLAAMLAIQAGHCLVFLRRAHREPSLSPHERLFLGGLFVFLFFSAVNLDNFTWGFQLSYILVFCSATLSIDSLIACAGRRRETPSPAARSGLPVALALAAAVLATYSLSNGVLIWPTLILVGLAVRLPERTVAVVAAGGLLVALLYFLGYQPVAAHTDLKYALQHPVELLSFVAAYVALPVSRLHHEVGVAAGIVQLLFLGWALAGMLLRRIHLSRLLVLSVGVMVFIVASACATAAGRITLGPPEGAMRYATPAVIYWACFITACLVVRRAPGQGADNRLAMVAPAAAVWAVLAVVPLGINEARRLAAVTVELDEAQTAVMAGVADPARIGLVFPDPALVHRLLAVLREHRLSIYSQYSGDITGRRMADMYETVSGPSACRGAFEFAEPVAGPAPAGSSITGWAWDTTANREPGLVLLASEGTVYGIGRFTRRRPDVGRAFGDPRMDRSGWFGYINPAGQGRKQTAYAVLAGGRKACALAAPDGSKRPTLAVFRKGDWFLGKQGIGGIEQTAFFNFGMPADLPVAADWDGTGAVRVGVYRNGEWYLDWNHNGKWDPADRQLHFGEAGDMPVVGDWDGSGRTKIGVFRNGTWILDWNGNALEDSGDRRFAFGLPGDIPVVGDWDNTGKQRIGVYRSGVWYLDIEGQFRFDSRTRLIAFGLPGDQPAFGDWSGLGRKSLAVFRPADGKWYIDYYGKDAWDKAGKIFIFGLPGDLGLAW